MRSKSELNREIADFLQCIPAPKRRDYELILLRCNFSDPADPLFPILLFLLFMEDNLSGRSETLADEFRKLRNTLEAGQPLPPRRSWLWWRITMLVLMMFQVIWGIFVFYRISGMDLSHRSLPEIQAFPMIDPEIRKMNCYWNDKLENAKRENLIMNSQELSPGDFIGAVVAVAMIFIVLIAAQITLILVAVSKLNKNDNELGTLQEFIKHNLNNSSYHDEIGNYLDRFPEPVEPPHESLKHDKDNNKEDYEDDLFNLK
ncbi:MAG: hypothetical protein JXR78_04670 [Victivallales bacterium]|nr:hypothetical protein [Victivallales bacterium]